MVYDLGLAWRNIRVRPIQTLIPALVIGLGIATALMIAMLADGTKEGIILASDPFGALVIGAKGSSQQLVINTVLLQDRPVGNISYDIYENLQNDERVQLAVPLAFGDNVGGARVIGTNHHFFELQTSHNSPPAFQLANGSLFAEEEEHEDESEEEHHEHTFEAVLGSRAAHDLGLDVGDQFTTTHGYGEGIASDHHEEAYTVVGILKPSNTPYDSAVLTSLESIWDVHHIDENDPLAAYIVDDAAEENQVTAILVIPASFAAQNQIWQEFYTRTDAQAAFPGEELVNLFELIDQAQQLLTLVGYVVLIMVILTIFLAMYNSTVVQERNLAIMRGLGSSQLTIARIVFFESILVSLLGAFLGRVIGYPTVMLVSNILTAQSALPIPIRLLPDWEAILIFVPLGVAIIAGFLPAMMAYRVNVVEKLFPS